MSECYSCNHYYSIKHICATCGKARCDRCYVFENGRNRCKVQPCEGYARFHDTNNMFFQRNEDGSVEIYSGGDFTLNSGTLIHKILPDAWASVVASMSAKGESDGRFAKAQQFHGYDNELGRFFGDGT